METQVAMMNPGTSLHFDGQALQDNDEAEYQREEQEKQQELRELLTNAFDDLIEDDDTTSLSSDVSHDSGAHSEEKGIRGRNREHWKPPINTWHLPGQTSTPLTLNAPPLKTPHGLQPQYTHPFGLNQPYPGFHGEGEYGQQNGHDFEEHPQGFEQNGEYDNVEEYQFQNGWDAEQEGYNQYGYQGNQFGERGEVDGGNEQVTGNHGHYGPGGYPYYNQINHQNGYGDQNQDYHHHGYQNNYYGERGYYGDQEGPDDNHNNPDVGLSPPEFASLPKRSPPQENYRVQYVGNRDKVPPVGQENGDNTVTQETNKQETEDEQDNFLKQDGTAEERQMVQLQILYKARGREITELKQDLFITKEDSAREIRILKHQLALAQGEKDGLTGSLEQSNQLIQEAKDEISQLQGKVASLETQVKTLTAAKEGAVKKLQAAESTVENLNQQLYELGSSESMSRAREQHEAVISNLQQKYEQEIYSLKTRLDEIGEKQQQKDEEVTSLRKQLNTAIKAAENSSIDRADTVNRLTRSLEDSQKQIQDLLSHGSSQELGILKAQLDQTVASKNMTDEMYKALQAEVSELKEQVAMYESASCVGVFLNSTAQPGVPSESFAQLGIRKNLDWKTPKIASAYHQEDQENVSPSDTTSVILKAELQKCLSNYKAKRVQVSGLQEEIRGLKTELENVRSKCEKAEKELNQKEAMISELEQRVGDLEPDPSGLSAVERRMKKEVEKLTREKDALLQEIEETKQRLEEVAANEEKLGEINNELHHQMAQLVKEFDEDKATALERCQEACLQHHELTKQKFLEEMMGQANADRTALVQEYDKKIQDLQHDVSKASKELSEVKEMYVMVCKQKDELEEILKKNWNEETEKQMKKLKEELVKEKEEALAALKTSLLQSSQTSLKDNDEEVSRKVQAEVAMAKIAWFEEQKSAKEMAIENALKQAEKEWVLRAEENLERQVERKLESAKSQWQVDRRLSFENELQQRLSSERLKWEAEHEREQTKVMERMKNEWMKEHQEMIQKQVSTAVQEAKEKWQKTESNSLEVAVRRAKQQIQTDMESSIAKLKKEIESIKLAKENTEKEFTSAKASWSKEKAAAMKEKDEERKKEIEGVEEEYQKQIQELVSQHQSVLQTKMQEMTKVKCELQKQHDDEIRQLKSKLEGKEMDKTSVQEIEKQCEDKLKKKLEEITSKQQEWERERQQLLEELSNTDKLLQSADIHLENEIQKLRSDLESQYRESVKADLESVHKEQEAAMNELRKEKDELVSQIQSAKNQVQKVEKDMLNVQGQLQEKEACLKQLQQTISTQECTNDTLSRKLGQQQEELEKYKCRKSEIQLLLQKTEYEHSEAVQGYKTRLEKLAARIQQLENLLKESEETKSVEIDQLREYLSEESAHAMETMKQKMIELKKEHYAAVEKLKRQWFSEKQALQREMSEKRKETYSTTVQTDGEETDSKMLKQLKLHYLEAVDKIREDVVKHVSATNARAQQKVKSEVAKECQLTATRLRKYYLKCLKKLLEDTKCPDKEGKLCTMEQMLLQFAPTPDPLTRKSTHTPDVGIGEGQRSRPRSPKYTIDVSVKGTVSPIENILQQNTGCGGRHQNETSLKADDPHKDYVGEELPAVLVGHHPSAFSPHRPSSQLSPRAGNEQTKTNLSKAVPNDKGSRQVRDGNSFFVPQPSHENKNQSMNAQAGNPRTRQHLRTQNYTSTLDDRPTRDQLNERAGQPKPYQYTSLRNSINSQISPDRPEALGLNIDDISELKDLPQQPRSFNPPPEKLTTDRCDSPIEGNITLRSRGSRDSCESVSSYTSTPRESLKKRQIPKQTLTQKSGPMKAVHSNLQELENINSTVPMNVHKPVPMVTRHTQVPSPAPRKFLPTK